MLHKPIWFTRLLSLLILTISLALSACNIRLLPEEITLSEDPPAELTHHTYGTGGEGIIGAILAFRAQKMQTIEVGLEIGPQITEEGAEIHQGFSLRYSQEPAR